MDNKVAYLLFELGSVQVYHRQTAEAQVALESPNQVYWQNTVTRQNYGPFISVVTAMKHYADFIAQPKVLDTEGLKNIIYVDFIQKKRVDSI